MDESSDPRDPRSDRSLRLWPGVVLVLLQWLAVFGTGIIAPGTMLIYFGMVGGPTDGRHGAALYPHLS